MTKIPYKYVYSITRSTIRNKEVSMKMSSLRIERNHTDIFVELTERSEATSG